MRRDDCLWSKQAYTTVTWCSYLLCFSWVRHFVTTRAVDGSCWFWLAACVFYVYYIWSARLGDGCVLAVCWRRNVYAVSIGAAAVEFLNLLRLSGNDASDWHTNVCATGADAYRWCFARFSVE